MSESFHMRGRLAGSASNFDVEHVGLGVRLRERRGGGNRGLAAFGPSQVLLGSFLLVRHFNLPLNLLCY